jgi:hypothetical protein
MFHSTSNKRLPCQNHDMKVLIKPTEKPEKLIKHLKPRVEAIERHSSQKIEVETDEETKMDFVPGIEEYTVDGETRQGLGGKPIHREAFMHVEDKKDAAKAFLETREGYKLYISTEREWDLRLLRRYNPGIIKADREVAEELDIEKHQEEKELSNEELRQIYRRYLTPEPSS